MPSTSTPGPGKPAAKKGDQIVALDTHIILVPSPGGPIPTPSPMPFAGQLTDALSADVDTFLPLGFDPQKVGNGAQVKDVTLKEVTVTTKDGRTMIFDRAGKFLR